MRRDEAIPRWSLPLAGTTAGLSRAVNVSASGAGKGQRLAKQSQMLDHNQQDHARDEPRRDREMGRSVVKDNAMPGYQHDGERNHHPYASVR